MFCHSVAVFLCGIEKHDVGVPLVELIENAADSSVCLGGVGEMIQRDALGLGKEIIVNCAESVEIEDRGFFNYIP